MNEDLRTEDIKKLQEEQIEGDWINLWEEKLHHIEHEDENQQLWSLSRNSFLEGFKLARGMFNKNVKSK